MGVKIKREKFDVEFERDILAQCLRDPSFLQEAFEVLIKHVFSNRELGIIWREVKKAWQENHEAIKPRVLLEILRSKYKSQPELLAVTTKELRGLSRRKPASPRSVLEVLEEFVKHNAVKTTIAKALDALDEGRIEDAEKELDAYKDRIPTLRLWDQVYWWEDFETRLKHYEREADPERSGFVTIRTGIPTLDRIMSGGLRSGELGLILATTNRGKSIFAANFAVAAARQGYGGILFALEMTGLQVARRIDARVFRLEHDRLKTFDFTKRELQSLKKKHAKMRKWFEDKIEIIAAPVTQATPEFLTQRIEERRKSGKRTDFVIFDSLDHVRIKGRRFDSKRLEQAEIYWWAKGLAAEQNLAVWSTTHAGREWARRIATAESTAESYDKARIADAVISLNQDASHKENGTMELFVAKHRDGASHVKIFLETHFEVMRFAEVTIEELEAKRS